MLVIYLSLIDSEQDKHLFIATYEKYRNSMVLIAKHYMCVDDLAEDVVHDTFLKLAKSIHRWRNLSDEGLKAYIFVSVRNQSVSTISKLQNERKYYISADIENVNFYKDAIIQNEIEVDELFLMAAEALPDILADVLMLRYYYGFKNKEIAKKLHITPNTVAQRLSRTKKILHEVLAKEELG